MDKLPFKYDWLSVTDWITNNEGAKYRIGIAVIDKDRPLDYEFVNKNGEHIISTMEEGLGRCLNASYPYTSISCIYGKVVLQEYADCSSIRLIDITSESVIVQHAGEKMV